MGPTLALGIPSVPWVGGVTVGGPEMFFPPGLALALGSTVDWSLKMGLPWFKLPVHREVILTRAAFP